MKTTSRLTILLSALLVMGFVTSAQLAFTQPSTNRSGPSGTDESIRKELESLVVPKVEVKGKVNAEMNPNLGSESQAITPQGAAGSGWKPDVLVSGETTSEIYPSIATFINQTTGDVILYAAMSKYDGTRYILQVCRSFDRGASWAWCFLGWWDNPAGRSIYVPSIAVSPYNGTVFVAAQDSAIGGFSNDISIWRINFATYTWSWYSIDGDADDDRNPQLVSEYSYGSGNWLYVSYEMVWTYDDRDVYFGRSTNWGQTWYTYPLRGGAADPDASDVFTQSAITYAQGNIYTAYRHSADYSTLGHIDVSYSINYGGTWTHVENVSKVPNDAYVPSVAGSRFGPWHQPATVIVAYQYAATSSNHDILIAWSINYGDDWTGGSDSVHQVAASADWEDTPVLTVDGMGTESTNVGGNFHLIYGKGYHIYYTQLPYWDIPLYASGPGWAPYWGYWVGWSSPHGKITDATALRGSGKSTMAITTYTRTVGGVALWEPGVVWHDYRYYSTRGWDILYTTPGTDFSITFVPSSQSVVAGKSIAYYVTVNLLAGPTAPAYLGGTPHWPGYMSVYVSALSYSVSPVNPTATSTLTLYTSNLCPAATYQLTVTATIGGYRRMVQIPYTVIAPPALTLNVNPTTVGPTDKVTLSGQLSPSPGEPTQIILYHRFPHETGTWVSATTVSTDAAGAYSVEYPLTPAAGKAPPTLKIGQHDFVAVWFDRATGSYVSSPIKVLTVA